jgi:CheY-like chemotaxis protein
MPIIALSANVMAEVIEKCVAAGFNSYVTKPVDFKMLSSEMARFLDREDPTKPHELMRAKV